mgnify:CR=1 FL=1
MKDELLFCPLGGSGEIGMNMNLFAFGRPDDQKWIIVDIGVTFADDSVPGIDLIYPDPGFIISKKENLLGIVLTHAHEDHIGALGYLIEQLEAPIFCRDFSARIAVSKLNKVGNDPVVLQKAEKTLAYILALDFFGRTLSNRYLAVTAPLMKGDLSTMCQPPEA